LANPSGGGGATKGRRLLLIDTCHAGNAYNQRLGNAAYHANIIAYTAARFDQTALEDAKFGHGLFTYAMVEGLAGSLLPGRIHTPIGLAVEACELLGVEHPA
jgi:uncharacterized caspase-like protein